jgi:hypothetical protein
VGVSPGDTLSFAATSDLLSCPRLSEGRFISKSLRCKTAQSGDYTSISMRPYIATSLLVCGHIMLLPVTVFGQEYLGQLGGSKYNYNSTSNRYGYGSPYNPDSINNSYGQYGNRFSDYAVNNPYAHNAPKLYDSDGNYRGRLSANKYDPDSISNPYGRYGSKYSADSINNPYGAGSRYRHDSPNNPYGSGWSIIGEP